MKLSPDAMPTTRQGTVLATLASATGSGKRAAKDMHVRSDVLWRMQEAGWVARDLHQEWYIKDPGKQALERWRDRPKPRRRQMRCGDCGEIFSTNCAEDNIECAVCGAKQCPYCHEWFGRDD